MCETILNCFVMYLNMYLHLVVDYPYVAKFLTPSQNKEWILQILCYTHEFDDQMHLITLLLLDFIP